MDLYHIWCDLKPGVGDMDFTDKLNAYLGGLADAGKIESYRITRRKLGLGREGLGEFHIMIDTRDLSQLDQAFRVVASRAGPVEDNHFSVNSLVENARFALYRDFPDEFRETGEEKF